MKKLCIIALALAGCGTASPGGAAWEDLFAPDLSDAIAPEGVWKFEGGVLTAAKDECIWTRRQYENFVLEGEFRTAPGTNSGIIVYCSDTGNWIPNAVEVQIADDFAEKWAKSPPSWRCGAIFGHVAPRKSAVKRPGEWNRVAVTCRGPMISVVLNGEPVSEMDMRLWTSEKKNPDGTDIPPWLSKPVATLATRGHIGLQGKHGDAPIWFRNLRIAPGRQGPENPVSD